MSKKLFIPTEEQRNLVFERLCKGEIAQAVRLDIINPETKKPLDIDTFCTKFAEEVRNARAKRGSAVASNLFAAATYHGVNRQTGLVEYNEKAMQQHLALDGRGLYGKKFDLDTSLPIKDQLGQIKQACADGLIGTQEMTGFVDACIKEMQAVEFEEIKRDFVEIKKDNESLRLQLSEVKK